MPLGLVVLLVRCHAGAAPPTGDMGTDLKLVVACRYTDEETPWCQVVSAPPASTSLDQELVKYFGRFLPVECLSWTVVELVGDGVELGLRVARQVGSFGEVLAQEAVGVLVAAPLPG